jgi:hypothetical protein
MKKEPRRPDEIAGQIKEKGNLLLNSPVPIGNMERKRKEDEIKALIEELQNSLVYYAKENQSV